MITTRWWLWRSARSTLKRNASSSIMRCGNFVVLDMPLLDTRREKSLLGTFISDLVLALLSYVAENERLNIKQRQAEGIAAAKARGVKFGRPAKPLPDNFHEICKQWRDKQLTLKQAARACNMPETSFFEKARRAGG